MNTPQTGGRGTGARAVLEYGPADFTIVESGSHVICAVTGRAIALTDLRYWSHELQEPYADAAAAFARWTQLQAEGRAP